MAVQAMQTVADSIPYFPVEGASIRDPFNGELTLEPTLRTTTHPILGRIRLTYHDTLLLHIANRAYSMLKPYRLPADGRLKTVKRLDVARTRFEGQYKVDGREELIGLVLQENVKSGKGSPVYDASLEVIGEGIYTSVKGKSNLDSRIKPIWKGVLIRIEKVPLGEPLDGAVVAETIAVKPSPMEAHDWVRGEQDYLNKFVKEVLKGFEGKI